MKCRASKLLPLWVIVFLCAQIQAQVKNEATDEDGKTTTSHPIVVNIDAQQTAEPVSKYEFGMFIEHIGTLIYRSLWSEMLDDRKFYFPISSKEPDAPAAQQGGPLRNAASQMAPCRSRRSCGDG